LSNTTGYSNTATGYNALHSTTDGYFNTASGVAALYSNARGYANTATGADALFGNTSGRWNTANGAYALFSNSTGAYSTALGYQALYRSKGSRNLALGIQAGSNLTSGDFNIYLGHTGFASESSTMRLGQVNSQTRTFIAGIAGVAISGAQVTINSAGQLGILPSSVRYKRDIQTMGARSQGMHQLRPVTFRYKHDPQGQRQYGLIAEEVAKVYPELVVRGTKGEVESVQYYELIPLLLNEVQHQQQALTTQSQQLSAQSQQLSAQSQQLAELKAQNERLQAALGQQNAAMAARLERLEAGAVRAATVAER